MVMGRLARVRLLFGPSAEAIGRVAAVRGAVAAAHEAFAEAHWAVAAAGDDATRLVLRQRGAALRAELRAAASASPVLAGDATAAVGELDDILRRVRPRTGSLASAILKRSWWDRLFELARGDAGIRAALEAFQDAAASGDQAALTRAAGELRQAVSARVSPSAAKELGDRINGVVRRLGSITAGGDGAKALVALSDHVDQLAPSDAARGALAKLQRAVRDHGDRWIEVANVVAGMKRAANPEEARSLIWRIKGMIAEMLAMATPAYRDLYERALADAEALARRLNDLSPGWEVTTRRAQVRAPASTTSARLAPFYDDAIIVRRIVAGQEEGEAIVVLATQVKSGDWSSSLVVDQINKDLSRELAGRIELDGRLYRLTGAPPEFATTRVFVGTSLPPGAAVAGAEAAIRPILLPMSAAEMEAAGLAWLEALGLLP
jgi:hypothetical protein